MRDHCPALVPVLVLELVAAGIDPRAIDRLRCPMGLALGSNQPGEIAVSLVAEILQVRDAARESGAAGT